MSSYFKASDTAANALYGDFKFKPYYNLGFHLDAFTSFITHGLRTAYNLVGFGLRLLITPLYVLNPLAWIGLPGHLIALVDNLIASILSAISVAIHPIVFTIRTLNSLCRGYEEGTDYDWGMDEEEADLGLAMAIF